tara:strand:- start:2653 stop:2940 length:288 start_codon:yes stop_codon:yes gene_type:complete
MNYKDPRLEYIEIDTGKVEAFMKLIDIYDPYVVTSVYLPPHLYVGIVYRNEIILSLRVITRDGSFYDRYGKDIEDKLREFKLSILSGQIVFDYYA